MSKRFIETERDRAMLVRFIESQALPFAASVTRGGKRSVEQNRLQRLWLSEISEQMGDRSSEDVRGYCKLHFGVPILREQDPGFREKYDKAVKPLSYEQKIAIMMEPLDLPVTRLMTTKQHTEYLDAIYQNFAKEGFILTEPSALARNYNPQSSDAPSPSDDGSDGEAASPSQTVAATLSPGDEPGMEEGSNTGQVTTEQAAPSSDPSADQALLLRVYRTMQDCVGPSVDDFNCAFTIFDADLAEAPDAVRHKAGTIRSSLEVCCGENPKRTKLQARKYLAGVIGVEEAELG